MGASVLVIDDEPLIRQSISGALRDEGFEISAAGTGQEAQRRFAEDRPEVVLLDLVLGDVDGLDLLRRFRTEDPDIKVLVITAHGSIDAAITAMRLGAYDFIKKPFELDEIIASVQNAVRTSMLERRVSYLQGRDRKKGTGAALVARSEAMQRVANEVSVIGPSPVGVVLVTGESGVGKQVIARMLHDLSAAAAGPFVELNCSAIPESLVESELFGHERGAFSDARERKLGLCEVADGGTLFLDEIGDLGQAAQAKLLTFIEHRTFRRLGSTATKRVEARIVAATNRDLASMVAERTFREDLWYRLNTITLVLPPLRRRPEDIPILAASFLAESALEFRRAWRTIAPETAQLLRDYRWPGNVRELRSVISRAALLNDGEILEPAHLPADLIAAVLAATPVARASADAASKGIPTLEEVELAHIRRVLDIAGGNRTLAAQHLGISRQTLIRRLGAEE